jgi:hypothetical protein
MSTPPSINQPAVSGVSTPRSMGVDTQTGCVRLDAMPNEEMLKETHCVLFSLAVLADEEKVARLTTEQIKTAVVESRGCYQTSIAGQNVRQQDKLTSLKDGEGFTNDVVKRALSTVRGQGKFVFWKQNAKQDFKKMLAKPRKGQKVNKKQHRFLYVQGILNRNAFVQEELALSDLVGDGQEGWNHVILIDLHTRKFYCSNCPDEKLDVSLLLHKKYPYILDVRNYYYISMLPAPVLPLTEKDYKSMMRGTKRRIPATVSSGLSAPNVPDHLALVEYVPPASTDSADSGTDSDSDSDSDSGEEQPAKRARTD